MDKINDNKKKIEELLIFNDNLINQINRAQDFGMELEARLSK